MILLLGSGSEFLRFRLDLSQQSSEIEINPSRRNNSGAEVIFVKRAAGNRHPPASCRGVRKGTFVHGFETPFHRDQAATMGKVPDGVHVTGECGDEWADKVVSHGHFPIERPRGKA